MTDPIKDMLDLRKIVGKISKLVSPGFGACHRCGVTWNCVGNHHSTWYTKQSGCFPLCQWCWEQLTPEERLPFYQDYDPLPDRGDWEMIKAAVMEGK